jgi:hypothetical protein
MTNKAYQILYEELKKEAESSKNKTREEIICKWHKIGVLTPTGKLSKNYKE